MNLSLLLLLLRAAPCPAAAPVADAPGLPAVARLPTVEAMRRNGEGKKLYRQERWDDARAKYRAALAADPGLLGAALNVACSYSRQKRYVEAAEEAARLIRRAYVPWSREVKEAADLGILEDHPAAYAKVQAARQESATAWGEQVRKGVLFVARIKPPIRVAGEGVLVLRLNQEIFSWIPETGRFFQVTAEDGRVLGFAVSSNGQRIAYLLGGKVVRAAGRPGMLRDLSLRVLDLPSMSLGPLVPIPGDVRRVQLWFAATQPEIGVTDRTGRHATFRLGTTGLVASPARKRPKGEDWVVLGEHGIELGKPYLAKGKCAFSLRATEDSAGRRRLQVARPGGKPFLLDTRYEAGLHGLPFPEHSSKPAR